MRVASSGIAAWATSACSRSRHGLRGHRDLVDPRQGGGGARLWRAPLPSSRGSRRRSARRRRPRLRPVHLFAAPDWLTVLLGVLRLERGALPGQRRERAPVGPGVHSPGAHKNLTGSAIGGRPAIRETLAFAARHGVARDRSSRRGGRRPRRRPQGPPPVPDRSRWVMHGPREARVALSQGRSGRRGRAGWFECPLARGPNSG